MRYHGSGGSSGMVRQINMAKVTRHKSPLIGAQ
jgi:hypothetical protein